MKSPSSTEVLKGIGSIVLILLKFSLLLFFLDIYDDSHYYIYHIYNRFLEAMKMDQLGFNGFVEASNRVAYPGKKNMPASFNKKKGVMDSFEKQVCYLGNASYSLI